MRPICVKCQRFYRPKKNGFYFIEAMPIGNETQPGTEAPELWTPYKVWSGDLYECQGCGHQVVSGVGSGPITEHYQRDFQEVVERTNASQLQINDC